MIAFTVNSSDVETIYRRPQADKFIAKSYDTRPVTKAYHDLRLI